MGQILIRNLDDRIIDALKRRAEAGGRSMEAEAREVLRQATRLTGEEKVALIKEMHARTAHLLSSGEPWREGWELIREARDAVDDRYR